MKQSYIKRLKGYLCVGVVCLFILSCSGTENEGPCTGPTTFPVIFSIQNEDGTSALLNSEDWFKRMQVNVLSPKDGKVHVDYHYSPIPDQFTIQVRDKPQLNPMVREYIVEILFPEEIRPCRDTLRMKLEIIPQEGSPTSIRLLEAVCNDTIYPQSVEDFVPYFKLKNDR